MSATASARADISFDSLRPIDVPQEAPQAFADAIFEVDTY
jgi:hypothetical protein